MASSHRDVADDLVVAALAAGQIVRLRAAGGSMRPTVHPGDVLRVCAGRPRPGEIALARAGADWIAHRVLRVEPGGFFVRGDNRRATEHFLCADAVVGVVVAIEAQRLTPVQRIRALARRVIALAVGEAPACPERARRRLLRLLQQRREHARLSTPRCRWR